MSIFGGSGDDGDDEPEIDHWKIMYREFDGNYQEADFTSEAIDSATALSDPLDEEAFIRTAENMDWPAGEYKCQARYVTGAFGPVKWVAEVGDQEDQSGQDDEMSVEEQILQQNQQILEMLANEGRVGGISDPDEARGAVFSRMLEGEVDPETAGTLRNFLEEWEKHSRDPVSDPGEFAGKMANAHLASGNTEVATAILDKWMTMEAGAGGGPGEGSILSLAQNADVDELDFDAIKTLGALRFLDDPRSMIHEAAGGLMDAADEAPAAQGQQQGQPDGPTSPIAAALQGQSQQEGQQPAESQAAPSEGQASPADQEAADSGDEQAADDAQSDGIESAADMTLEGLDSDSADAAAASGDSPADPMSASPEDAPSPGVDASGDELGGDADAGDPVTHSEVEASPEVADAIEGDDAGEQHTESCPYCGTTFTKETPEAAQRAVNGHKGSCEEKSAVEREAAEIEQEADPEAGEFANAQEAVQRLEEAADADTEGETPDGEAAEGEVSG